MKKTDFRVCKCTKCNKFTSYYVGDMTPDEIKEEFDDVDIVDGKIHSTCYSSNCDGQFVEIDEENYSPNIISEILGNMLEDDNRHNLTSIGSLFNDLMTNCNISEDDRRKVLMELLNYYDNNHSLRY